MIRAIGRTRGGAVAAALVVLVLAWPPMPAYAHATLVSSSPSEGEQFATAPTSVSFEFSEEMAGPAYVVVTPPDDADLLVDEPVVDRAVVRQEIRPGGSDGTWTTAVRAVSKDGHPVTAQITFRVGAGADEDRTVAPAEPATTTGRDGGAGRDPGGWSRTQTDIAVGAGLFLVAGLLLVLARRSSR